MVEQPDYINFKDSSVFYNVDIAEALDKIKDIIEDQTELYEKAE